MDLLTTTAYQWQEALRSNKTTSVDIAKACLGQIERHNRKGQRLNALINVCPWGIVHEQARVLDEERAAGKLRSRMHGIPIIIKDIFPVERSLGMPTTCGSYAFRSAYGKENCPLVQRLLDAGLIIVGKSNLNEYCRLRNARSGHSLLGGQTQSPFIEGGLAENEAPVGNSSMSGSSSGSVAGVAAGFAPVAIGTETIGSIVHPSHRGGLYSLKITNARAPKEGVLTLSKEYDSLGPMAKSAVDIWDMMSVIHDKPEPLGESEVPLRVGFVDARKWRFPDEYCPLGEEIREDLGAKYDKLVEGLGSSSKFQVVSNIPLQQDQIKYEDRDIVGSIVDAQFRDNFAEFAAGLTGTDIETLADLIAYNEEHADCTLPDPSDEQKAVKKANETHEPPDFVEKAAEHGRQIAGPGRLDKVMEECNVDLIVGPGDSTLFSLSTYAGYPIGSVPWTSVKYNGKDSRPEGLLVIAKANREDLVLHFMLQYEEMFPGRPIPEPLRSTA